MRIKSADLKKKKIVVGFCGFSCFVYGVAADCRMLLRMIGEIKVARNRFGCVFVVFLYVTKVFSESVA